MYRSSTIRYGRLLQQCYSSSSKEWILSDLWKQVVASQREDEKALNLFDLYLKTVIKLKRIPLDSTTEQQTLKILLKDSRPITVCSISNLYSDIKNNKINDSQILTAIRSANSKSLLNVKYPNRLRNISSKNRLSFNNAKALKPKQDAELDGILNILRSEKVSNDIDFKSTTKLKHTSNNNILTPPLKGQEFDVNLLKRYMDKVEKKNGQLRQLAWEQKKVYDWNQKFEAPKLGSASEMLFDSPNNKIFEISFLQDIIKFQSKNSKVSGSNEYLVYNASEDSMTTASSENIDLLNVQHQSLFDVIEYLTLPPEKSLTIVNKLEKAGWELIGTYTNTKQHIIFKKTYETAKEDSAGSALDQQQARRPRKLIFVTGGVLGLMLGYKLMTYEEKMHVEV